MKRIAILGSTGSIGCNALKIAKHLGPSEIKVVALAAKSNIDLLEEQAKEFFPDIIAVFDKDKALMLQKRLPKIRVVGGMEGLKAVASHVNADLVISAMVGTLALEPTVAAISAGKNIALANKEALISGGALIMALVREKGVTLIPVDSEHSAIFQCLNGENPKAIERLILTSSGGPFRTHSMEQLQQVTVESALNHPKWAMGPKITIDSSTMMNKGLEVIEAHWLFNVPVEKIDIIVHPQHLIHSMVEFVDRSIIAQMNVPDMVVPIQYAMTYPERKLGTIPKFDFIKHGTLDFFMPDMEKFRCLKLAYHAVKEGGSLPCYMNAANEVLVHRFLDRQISWIEIVSKLEHLMSKHKVAKVNSLDTVLAIDTQAREEALKI